MGQCCGLERRLTMVEVTADGSKTVDGKDESQRGSAYASDMLETKNSQMTPKVMAQSLEGGSVEAPEEAKELKIVDEQALKREQ